MDALRMCASKYIWWKSSEEALKHPRRVIAQTMNLGDFNDVNALLQQVGEKRFIEALEKAEAGEFSIKSWYYWHYRLHLSALEKVPPLPKRILE